MIMPWDWTIDGWIIIAGALAATSAALLGNFLVLRRMSLMGDAIAHAVLPGIAIAFLLTHSRSIGPLFVGAIVVGLVTAIGTQVITRYGKVETGAAMGVIFSVLFALGLILIRQAADHVDLDPNCVLFGNLTQIPLAALDGAVPPAVVRLALTLGLNVLFVALCFKELQICAFDPALATTLGIPANLMHYLLMIMVAITTVANFEAVGSILVIAMFIVPPATALLLTDRLGLMVLLSVVLGGFTAVAGHLLAIWGPPLMGTGYSLSSAPMIVTVAGLVLTVTIVASPKDGLIVRARNRWRLVSKITREDILGLLYRWQELDPAGQPMRTHDLLTAVGDRWRVRHALGTLTRRQAVLARNLPSGEPGLLLSGDGRQIASRLVRAHRLWEVYLARHFRLPLDHLHMPAERMEHFLTPELTQQIAREAKAGEDPHGRSIPPPESGAVSERPNES